MSKLLVRSFGVSIDGYGAGPSQDLQNPLGVNGTELMDWVFHTRVWRRMHGPDGRRDGHRQRDGGTGLHRNRSLDSRADMFGPVRGPLAGSQLEGLVGRRAQPHACLRSDPSPAPAARGWREVRNFASSPKAFTTPS